MSISKVDPERGEDMDFDAPEMPIYFINSNEGIQIY